MRLFDFMRRRLAAARSTPLDAPSPTAALPSPEAHPPAAREVVDDDGVRRVINGDVQRARRIPPGQSRAKKWPVLQYGETPVVHPSDWRLRVFGAVNRGVTLTWEDLLALPRLRVDADMHCVTSWTVLDQRWEGIALETVLDMAGVSPEARFLVAWGADRVGSSERYSTNMPLEDARSSDVLIATHCNGAPLTVAHGGPVRLVVPLLYAWKSAKWLDGLELLVADRPGFWERNGYHHRGDPWAEQRFD